MAVDKVNSTSSFTTPSKGNSQLSKAKDFCKNIEDYYIYDEKGNFVGIDYQKLYSQAGEQMDEFKSMGVTLNVNSLDSFVNTAKAKKESEEEEKAKENKSIIESSSKSVTETYKEVTNALNLTKGSEHAEEEAYLKSQVYNLQAISFDLTKTNASNTTIIESAKEFQYKAKKLEEDITAFQAAASAEPEKATSFSLETEEEIYNKENELAANEVEAEIPDLLDNNPFWNNALETFAGEEEKTAA